MNALIGSTVLLRQGTETRVAFVTGRNNQPLNKTKYNLHVIMDNGWTTGLQDVLFVGQGENTPAPSDEPFFTGLSHYNINQ